MGHKRALIVGINYVGTGNDLQGCINDANNMNALLKDHFGFTDIRLLLEKDATTANIKDSLRWLVSGCRPGDVLFFHYSGHGSQIPDTSDPDVEPDGLDEIICPIDLDWKDNVITDDYMKWVFDTVPAGVNLTVVLDSCHSGTALDQANQYMPLGLGEARVFGEGDDGRYLAPPLEVQQLIEQLAAEPKPRVIQSRDVNQTGLLISGCQSQQTSADAYIGGVYQGAATYSLLSTVKSHSYDLDYKALVDDMNNFMVKNGYSQRPELNGSASLFTMKFLAEPNVTEQVVNDYVPVDIPPAPETTQNVQTVLENIVASDDKQNLILKVVGGLAVLGMILYVIFTN